MASWVGPTMAVSLALIAISVVALAVVVLVSVREAQTRVNQVGAELAELRHDLAPALNAVNSFAETSTDISEIASHEIKELAATSAVLRTELHAGLDRARTRLQDFDALIEVLQEEVEDAALELAVGVRTIRATTGVVGTVARAIRRRDSESD